MTDETTLVLPPGYADWLTGIKQSIQGARQRARQALEGAWPRDTLTIQIKNALHLRQGAAVTNFEQRLPSPQAGLAREILKDPYHFDFLGLGGGA